MLTSRAIGFNSYFGIEEIAITEKEFEDALGVRTRACVDAGFRYVLPDKKTIRDWQDIVLTDTFFSDVFPEDLLRKLLSKVHGRPGPGGGQQNGNSEPPVTCKIMLVSPFTELAKLRANALDGQGSVMANICWRLNTGLRKISRALMPEDSLPNDTNEFENNKKELWYLERQLRNLADRSIDKDGVEVRFITHYTDLPCYFIGPYAFKGVIFPSQTARQNPWTIYVDDPSEPRDSYTSLKEATKELWDQAKTAEDIADASAAELNRRRTVFISWGGKSSNAKRLVFEYIEAKPFDTNSCFKATDFQTVVEEQPPSEPTMVAKVYPEGIDSASAAVVLLLGEDDVSVHVPEAEAVRIRRPRQNVVHELGYIERALPADRILVIAEKHIQMPSNKDGVLVFQTTRDDIDAEHTDLELAINKFLDNIKK